MNKNFADLFATWVKIFKSIPAEQLEDIENVQDLWSEAGGQFAAPSRSEIKTGSPQESSGGGAERMVRQYSDPAPQTGMTEKYAEFSSMLRDFGKSIDGLRTASDRNRAQIMALASLVGPQAKAEAPAAKSADTESALAKAEAKLKKARSELRKAEMSDDEDKEEREEKKSFLDQAAVALKSAKRLLAKAEDEDMKEDEEERAEKARSDFRTLSGKLRKASDEGTKREEAETKEMEKAAADKVAAEAARKAADIAAQKATEEAAAKAKGGEATEQEGENEKTEKALAPDASKKAEPAAAAAAAAATAPVDKSVRDQLQVLTTSVKGLMETVMAGSKTGPMPVFAKSAPLANLNTQVESAIDSGELDDALEIMKAQTLLSHIRAVQEGRMDAAIVDDEIAKAPDNVRQLFQPVQAAA